jgi:hypothetical protein
VREVVLGVIRPAHELEEGILFVVAASEVLSELCEARLGRRDGVATGTVDDGIIVRVMSELTVLDTLVIIASLLLRERQVVGDGNEAMLSVVVTRQDDVVSAGDNRLELNTLALKLLDKLDAVGKRTVLTNSDSFDVGDAVGVDGVALGIAKELASGVNKEDVLSVDSLISLEKSSRVDDEAMLGLLERERRYEGASSEQVAESEGNTRKILALLSELGVVSDSIEGAVDVNDDTVSKRRDTIDKRLSVLDITVNRSNVVRVVLLLVEIAEDMARDGLVEVGSGEVLRRGSIFTDSRRALGRREAFAVVEGGHELVTYDGSTSVVGKRIRSEEGLAVLLLHVRVKSSLKLGSRDGRELAKESNEVVGTPAVHDRTLGSLSEGRDPRLHVRGEIVEGDDVLLSNIRLGANLIDTLEELRGLLLQVSLVSLKSLDVLISDLLGGVNKVVLDSHLLLHLSELGSTNGGEDSVSITGKAELLMNELISRRLKVRVEEEGSKLTSEKLGRTVDTVITMTNRRNTRVKATSLSIHVVSVAHHAVFKVSKLLLPANGDNRLKSKRRVDEIRVLNHTFRDENATLNKLTSLGGANGEDTTKSSTVRTSTNLKLSSHSTNHLTLTTENSTNHKEVIAIEILRVDVVLIKTSIDRGVEVFQMLIDIIIELILGKNLLTIFL